MFNTYACFRCSFCGWEFWDGGPNLTGARRDCPLCGWNMSLLWVEVLPIYIQEEMDVGNIWSRPTKSRFISLVKLHASDLLSYNRKTKI